MNQLLDRLIEFGGFFVIFLEVLIPESERVSSRWDGIQDTERRFGDEGGVRNRGGRPDRNISRLLVFRLPRNGTGTGCLGGTTVPGVCTC